MSVLSRLHPEHPSPRQLSLVIAGSGEVPAVVMAARRLQTALEKAGHHVTSRLALQSNWGVGRFHPDDVETADLVVVLTQRGKFRVVKFRAAPSAGRAAKGDFVMPITKADRVRGLAQIVQRASNAASEAEAEA
jgi:hypothetical protein